MATDLALEPHSTNTSAPPTSHIIADHVDTGAVADGIVLESWFDVPAARTLILTSDDTPFEELLHIQLFDDRWRRLDVISLGWPGTSGALRDLVRLDAHKFGFRFFAGQRMILVVHPRPRWMLSRLTPSFGVWSNPLRRSLLSLYKVAD